LQADKDADATLLLHPTLQHASTLPDFDPTPQNLLNSCILYFPALQADKDADAALLLLAGCAEARERLLKHQTAPQKFRAGSVSQMYSQLH
jgi:hypothetical protein